MRKFKQVKRKEIIFDLAEWNEVKRRAEQISMTTRVDIGILFELRSVWISREISYAKAEYVSEVCDYYRLLYCYLTAIGFR